MNGSAFRRRRVLLVDEDHAFLDNLSGRIAKDPCLDVVARARTGQEAIEIARKLQPDLVVLDVLLPDMTGFEAVAWLKEQRPAPLVLLVTFDASRIAELASMKVGADACISRTELPERVLLVLQELLWPHGKRQEGR